MPRTRSADRPASHSHTAITSSVNPNWRTPSWLYQALDTEFAFAIDFAADADNCKHHAKMYLGPGSAICEDALCGVPWVAAAKFGADGKNGDRLAGFLNHPYSRDEKMPHEPWMRAAAEAGEQMIVVAVVPFSPQTKWWRTYIHGPLHRATEIRRFPYRLKFEPPPGYSGKATGANVNTAIVIWRPSDAFVEPWAPFERYWDPPARRLAGVETIDADE